jgi:hypothetical protein
MPSTGKPKRNVRKPAAKRVPALKSRAKTAAAPRKSAEKKIAVKQTAPKRVAAKKGGVRYGVDDGYVVYESPIKPRHFTVEQIRRAVKAVLSNG